MPPRLLAGLFACFLAVAMTGCGEESSAPSIGSTITLAISGGDQQSGPAGAELPVPLKVTATDETGKLLRGILVSFKVTTGGGSMYAGAAITDNRGIAQDWWTLGQVPGMQTVDVVSVDPGTGAKQHFGTFSATALAPASLTISPPTHSFGAIQVGATSTPAVFTVTNAGGLASSAVGISLGGANAGEFSLSNNTCVAALPAGGTCTVAVTFAPASPGPRAATLTAGAGPASASAELTGAGASPAAITISPTSASFGSVTVGLSSVPQTFTITNVGGSPTGLVIPLVTGANPNDFPFGSNNCGTLQPQTSCTIDVRFIPSAAGSRTATFSVQASPGGSVTASLSGTGVNPTLLTITPTSHDFGTVNVNGTSANQNFTVRNTGGAPSLIVVTQLSGQNPTYFNIANDGCRNVTLIPNGTCVIVVHFRALDQGVKQAALFVGASSGAQVTASLMGTAVVPAQLAITPTNRDFGQVLVGNTSAPTAFQVTNSGAVPTSPISVNIAGVNAGDFDIGTNSCSQATLAPQAICTVVVTFGPQAAGSRSATLVVNASQGGQVTSLLTGTGTAAVAQLTATPTSWNFGNVNVGTTSTVQSFQIRNVGGANSGPLTISISGLNASDFDIGVNCDGVILPANATCTVQVTATPPAPGVRNAILSITATPGGSVPPIPLSVTGTVPAMLAANPQLLNFGTVPVGTASSQSVIIRNVGGSTSGPLQAEFSGSHASDFMIVDLNRCFNVVLVAGQQCSFQVTFTPSAPGPRSATLTWLASPGGSANVSVSGVGSP